MPKQEIPYQRLPVINAPQKSRDALGVSASNQRWIFLCSGGYFRRLTSTDQVKKTLAHRSRLASVPSNLTVRIRHGSGQNRLLRPLDDRTRFGAVGEDAESDDQIDHHRYRLAVQGRRAEARVL